VSDMARRLLKRSGMLNRRITIGPLPVDNVTHAGALRAVDELVAAGRGALS